MTRRKQENSDLLFDGFHHVSVCSNHFLDLPGTVNSMKSVNILLISKVMLLKQATNSSIPLFPRTLESQIGGSSCLMGVMKFIYRTMACMVYGIRAV